MNLVIAVVTSNLCERDYSVLFSNDDVLEGNLKISSLIRADKIYTLSKHIVIKKFGSIKPEIVEQVK